MSVEKRALPSFSARHPWHPIAPSAGFSDRRVAAKVAGMQSLGCHRQRGRVLAVDDSPVIRVLVTASLEALGYSVQAVDNGHEALAASKLENFDAIILDVDMPGMNGLEVGRALRRDPKTSLSIIIMHTSLEETVVRNGFDEYDVFLAKPCDARFFGARVDRVVREHREQRSRSQSTAPEAVRSA